MQDMLVLSIDAESETGEPIAKRFAVRGFPALLFLNSDGSPRDSIGGYMPADPFKAEVERIIRGESTINTLLAKVEANGDDLDARSALADKLGGFGDQAGREAQLAEIARRDPEAKHIATRRLRYERVKKEVLTVARGEVPDPGPIAECLEGETDSGLLLEGHYLVSRIYMDRAKKSEDEAAATDMRAKAIHSMQIAWKVCPADQREGFGNALSWGLWEARDGLDGKGKAFALDIAMTAAKNSKDPNVLDTLACCYFMNGQSEKAIATIDRCIELQPENGDWKERRAMFETPN